MELPAILTMLETAKDLKIVMVELDSGRDDPMTPFDAASTSKEYLKSLGYRLPLLGKVCHAA